MEMGRLLGTFVKRLLTGSFSALRMVVVGVSGLGMRAQSRTENLASTVSIDVLSASILLATGIMAMGEIMDLKVGGGMDNPSFIPSLGSTMSLWPLWPR